MLRLALALTLTFTSAAAAEPPWVATHARIAAEKNELSTRLGVLWTELRARLAAERPDLLARLTAEPPKPRPTGYGLLPVIEPDDPEKEALHEVRSSLKDLEEAVAAQRQALAELARRLPKEPGLEPLLDAYLAQARVFGQIDNDLNYHAVWQPQAARFKKYNALLALYKTWRASPGDSVAKARLEKELLGFSPAPGLRIENGLLRVPLQTDIEDEAFLTAFIDAVQSHWNESAAMRRAGLRIEIHGVLRRPASLYPEGPPARGAELETAKHLARFSPEAPVLTTGAKSLVASQRAILLDPAPTTRRILAHEFSHLLGFDDSYLHAFEGSEQDPYGVVWWEVCAFPAELMCNSRGGRVSEGMVRRLLAAYASSVP